jgi:chromosome partitioning protein
VVIDAPGNDTFLSRLVHSYADTIITPINDSFVDLNLLAKVDDETFRMDRHGLYSEVVWQAKMHRAQRSGGEVDWVILRNRLSHVDAHNKRNVLTAMENFSKRSGARLAEGLSERVIYKELFLKGLTLLDVMGEGAEVNITMSHVTARQELRRFMDFLGLSEKLNHRKKLRNLVEESKNAVNVEQEKEICVA